MLADDLMRGLDSFTIAEIKDAIRSRSTYEALDLFQRVPIHEIRTTCLDVIECRGLFDPGRGYLEAAFSLWRDIIIGHLKRCRENENKHPSQVFIEETERLTNVFIFCNKGGQSSKFGRELEVGAIVTLTDWYLEDEVSFPSLWEWRCVAKPVLKRLSGIPEILQDQAVTETAEKLMLSVIQRLLKKQEREASVRIYWVSDWAMVLQVLKTVRNTKFVSLKSALADLRNKIAEGIIRPAQDDDQLEFDAGHHLMTIDTVLCSLV